MSDRPSQLVLIIRDGEIELVSAHYADGSAENMRDWLCELGASAHLITVPEAEGLMKPVGKPVSPKFAPAPVVIQTPAAAPLPVPFKRAQTAEEFQAETIALMENGADGMMWRDADAHFSEGGAVS
jgi:hypothetical protein